MATAIPKTERYYAKDRAAWRSWLLKNHAVRAGIWLIYYKKNSGRTRVAYSDAVEEALCFGWIDTTMNPIDEDSYMQLFTPRKPKSTWSKLNKDRVESLVAAGLMMPAGMEKVNVAKENGSWSAIDGVESLTLPPELKKAYTANKKAKKYFESLTTWNKKYVLYYVNNVKDPVKKAARIAEIIAAHNESRMPERFVRKKK